MSEGGSGSGVLSEQSGDLYPRISSLLKFSEDLQSLLLAEDDSNLSTVAEESEPSTSPTVQLVGETFALGNGSEERTVSPNSSEKSGIRFVEASNEATV